MLLCILGVSWAVYIRTWQLFLWEAFGDVIQSSLEEGYTLCSKWWKVEVSCMNDHGDVRSWKGGVFARPSIVDSDSATHTSTTSL